MPEGITFFPATSPTGVCFVFQTKPASPKTPEPKPASPKTPEPKPASPKTPEPKPASPKTPEPKPASPKTPEPKKRPEKEADQWSVERSTEGMTYFYNKKTEKSQFKRPDCLKKYG